MSDRIAVMSEGRVEQIGTPEEIYHEPASVFVAGFIGDGQPVAGRGRSRATATSRPSTRRAATGVPIPDGRRARVRAMPATLMVRPERVHLQRRRASPATGRRCPPTVVDLVFQGPVVRFDAARRRTAARLVAHVGPDERAPAAAAGRPGLGVLGAATRGRLLRRAGPRSHDPEPRDRRAEHREHEERHMSDVTTDPARSRPHGAARHVAAGSSSGGPARSLGGARGRAGGPRRVRR